MAATAAAVVAPPHAPTATKTGAEEEEAEAEQAMPNAVEPEEATVAAKGEVVGEAKDLTAAAAAATARTKEKDIKALAEKAVQLFDLFDGEGGCSIFVQQR